MKVEHRQFKSTSLILILFLATACDCIFNYKFEAINETREAVLFTFKSEGSQQRFILTPGEKKEIFIREGFRCGCSNCVGTRIRAVDSTVGYFLSDVLISKNDTLTVTDFNNENNWDFESSIKLGVYTARITETDF